MLQFSQNQDSIAFILLFLIILQIKYLRNLKVNMEPNCIDKFYHEFDQRTICCALKDKQLIIIADAKLQFKDQQMDYYNLRILNFTGYTQSDNHKMMHQFQTYKDLYTALICLAKSNKLQIFDNSILLFLANDVYRFQLNMAVATPKHAGFQFVLKNINQNIKRIPLNQNQLLNKKQKQDRKYQIDIPSSQMQQQQKVSQSCSKKRRLNDQIQQQKSQHIVTKSWPSLKQKKFDLMMLQKKQQRAKKLAQDNQEGEEEIESANFVFPQYSTNQKLQHQKSKTVKQDVTRQGNQKQCSICLLQFKSQASINYLICFHQFHVECIQRWFTKSELCPICNTNQFQQGNKRPLLEREEQIQNQSVQSERENFNLQSESAQSLALNDN